MRCRPCYFENQKCRLHFFGTKKYRLFFVKKKKNQKCGPYFFGAKNVGIFCQKKKEVKNVGFTLLEQKMSAFFAFQMQIAESPNSMENMDL